MGAAEGGGRARAAAERCGRAVRSAAARARPKVAQGAALARAGAERLRPGVEKGAVWARGRAAVVAAELRPGLEAAWAQSGGDKLWQVVPAAVRTRAPLAGAAAAGVVLGTALSRRGAKRRFHKEREALCKRISELESTQHPLLH